MKLRYLLFLLISPVYGQTTLNNLDPAGTVADGDLLYMWDLDGVPDSNKALDISTLRGAMNFLPIDGSSPMTGELTAAVEGIEFTETDTITDCSSFSATGGGIFFDDSEGVLKKCEDNNMSVLGSGGGGGGGTVDTSGSPAVDQVAVFADGDTITGTSNLTFDGTAVSVIGDISLDERADHASTITSGKGYLWVKNDVPASLMFTDDAGTDLNISTASSGDVFKVATPLNNQVGVWTGDGTLEGDTALTFSDATDTLDIAASGKYAVGGVDIIDDALGTTTLSNIDAVDATTEATIEAAIDALTGITLSNSTIILDIDNPSTVQGQCTYDSTNDYIQCGDGVATDDYYPGAHTNVETWLEGDAPGGGEYFMTVVSGAMAWTQMSAIESTYMAIAGGTFTGEVVLDELGLEGQPTDSITDCTGFAATGGGMFYDDSEGKWKKCEDNVLSDLDTNNTMTEKWSFEAATTGDDIYHYAPAALTISRLDCLATGSPNVHVVTLEECDSSGGTCVTTGLTTSHSAAGVQSDTAATNGTVDAGDYWGIDTTSLAAAATWMHCTATYTYD